MSTHVMVLSTLRCTLHYHSSIADSNQKHIYDINTNCLWFKPQLDAPVYLKSDNFSLMSE